MSDTERRSTASIPKEEEASFLSRWSRRKLQARDPEAERLDGEASDARPPVADASTAEVAPATARPPEPAPREPTDEDMPPLESLHQEADVSMFFSPKVSPQLRRQALRKLFHTPKFNIRDGLDDFDEDYTCFAPLGDTVTADMRYMKDLAERRARDLAEREARATRPVAEASPDESPAIGQAPAEASAGPEAGDVDGTLADTEPRARSASDTSDEERSA